MFVLFCLSPAECEIKCLNIFSACKLSYMPKGLGGKTHHTARVTTFNTVESTSFLEECSRFD